MRLFIFDMGNVVIKHIHCLEAVAASLHLDFEDFISDYRRYEFPLMEGYIETSVYWEHINRRYGLSVTGEPFVAFFDPLPNVPVITEIKELRSRGDRVVCGSNTFACHWEKLRKMGMLDIFDKAYASHEMKLVKPERQFFEEIMKEEGFPPNETWFVDDYAENIDAAKKLGIHTFLYDYASDASNKELSLF